MIVLECPCGRNYTRSQARKLKRSKLELEEDGVRYGLVECACGSHRCVKLEDLQ